ncbi:hypothetical protein GCM10020367_18250 [Streptomyces sannanensis]|uniref:DUF3558 domain-containing protein n=1 Tax=Streptomyces sannanensis TaxID=285536 RepID=A0ABP6S8T5_9ACTN
MTAATLTAGCQSDGGTAPLSLNRLTETADGVPPEGTNTCPLPYDMAKAAKAAGLDAAAGPGPVQDSDAPVATAEGGKRAKPGEPLAQNPGALVSCTFHIGRDDVQVHTVATRKPHAIAPLAPVVGALAGASTDDLISYMKKAGNAAVGEVVVTDNGNVAAVRLKLDGDGDAFLLVGVGEAGSAAPDRKQVGDLAEALAGQVE